MSLTQFVFHKAAEADKQKYQKGLMPLLGSKLMYKIRVKHAHDIIYQLIVFGLYYYIAVGVPSYALEDKPYGVFIAMIYLFSVVLIFMFDLDTLECYLRGYKKSSYYLATKEELKSIAQDPGLIGEYKSYVLSRTLNIPHKTLHNVCIPMRNGNFQEIDTIIITRNIIYVVECKNRGGDFVGEYDKEDWVQYIGRQQHKVENVYMQNQKHTMALDQFLLDRGIIKNGQNVCLNVVFTTGEMTLPATNVPLDFIMGDAKAVRKFIEKNDKNFDDGTDTTGIMNEIYEALLPYSLYTKSERAAMMGVRDVRGKAKEFALGEFHTKYVDTGVPGVTDRGEVAAVRSNRLYTQVQISMGSGTCWQTRTDIGNQMAMNPNQISKGVDRERVEAYKRALGKEPKLILKKAVWIVFGVILFTIIGSF